MRPIDAKRESQIAKLTRDNYPARHDRWSILISEGEIALYPPAPIIGYYSIPRAHFDAIIRWYTKEQAK